MNDKIMEARREKFEVWYAEYTANGWSVSKIACWTAYNAALDSLCVELPRAGRGSDGYPIYDAIATKEAIHAAGVKTK